jgi:hypothetical protein
MSQAQNQYNSMILPWPDFVQLHSDTSGTADDNRPIDTALCRSAAVHSFIEIRSLVAEMKHSVKLLLGKARPLYIVQLRQTACADRNSYCRGRCQRAVGPDGTAVLGSKMSPSHSGTHTHTQPHLAVGSDFVITYRHNRHSALNRPRPLPIIFSY